MSWPRKFLFVFVLALGGCQTPETQIVEQDLGLESRQFSKIQFAQKPDLNRAVIIDVRSRFDFEMSKLPRSFFALAEDWDLRGYSGQALDEKRESLQRLLVLHGVDPLVQVLILGRGLQGRGEEFLLATTLKNLGIQRVAFLETKAIKKALAAKNVPPLKNLETWPLKNQANLACDPEGLKSKKGDIQIGGPGERALSAAEVFDKDLNVSRRRFPKRLNLQVTSPQTYWSFGLALHLKNLGRQVCVI